uniref:Uncharacterized protein n=1 Tax=Arundo donax TaxID=35708 RepID=A0A0A9GJ53_ARUDO
MCSAPICTAVGWGSSSAVVASGEASSEGGAMEHGKVAWLRVLLRRGGKARVDLQHIRFAARRRWGGHPAPVSRTSFFTSCLSLLHPSCSSLGEDDTTTRRITPRERVS